MTLGTYVIDAMPCPIDLYMVINRVSKLRGLVAGHDDDFCTSAAVQAIFDAIRQFNAEKWAAGREPGERQQNIVIGRLFAAAIQLYAVLTLPQTALVTWVNSLSNDSSMPPSTPSASHDIYLLLRKVHTKKLFLLLRYARGTLHLLWSLHWPLIVGGVAASNGTAEDRDFVRRSMLEIYDNPSFDCKLKITLHKVEAFWGSGKTGWDDCFDEPVRSCIY